MTVAEILVEVKNQLGVTGSYQDSTIISYINTVMNFMRSAGVKDPTSSAAVGCVCRGVVDLWNYNAGETKFSEAFQFMLISLC